MPKPIKFIYQKKEPNRDSSYIIIVCEGAVREKKYFDFFDGLSSRVTILPVVSLLGSAPRLLPEAALAKEAELDFDPSSDQTWFVIDTDRWRNQLHEIRQECTNRQHWNVVQSNPCFEVWLYMHVSDKIPDIKRVGECNSWKGFLPTVIAGGFNSDMHPIAIEVAIVNSKACYNATGYLPEVGCTQLWQLGEVFLPLIKKDLDLIRDNFPMPVHI